jgi:hypothetical protein
MPKLWRNLVIEVSAVSAVSAFRRFGSFDIIYGFRRFAFDQMSFGRQPYVFRSIIGDFPIFNLDTVGGDPKVLISKFFKATCTAIASSVLLVSTMERGTKGIYTIRRKKLKMDPKVPDWDTLPVLNGKISYYCVPETMKDIKNPKYYKHESNLINRNYSYKRAPKPFSVSAERYAYYALNLTHATHGSTEEIEKTVMKEYVEIGRKANSIERYLETVEVSTIAHFLSTEFNLAAEEADIRKKVKFLKVQLLRQKYGSETRYYTVEPMFHAV